MDDRIEDDDRDALAGLSSVPPPLKSQSYSQQLRAASDQKRHQMRKHSLDEDQIPQVMAAYYDSSDDDFLPYSTSSAIGGEYFLLQRLDQNLCTDGGGLEDSRQSQPLVEFVGSGGSAGVFKVPIRASVHPGRPTCLELRPHPLLETQVGKFFRNIACTEIQLWAGQECGVRFWNVENAYESGSGLGGRVMRGDEDVAPFYESISTSPTMCLIVDSGNRLVWSGHKDGKIRSWKMDQSLEDMPFKEGLSWQAHRGPVLSMTLTAYGDLWSGGEGGIIKVWPWEAIEKSLCLSSGERHMAALLVERSYIDLRSQVTVNGVCNISSQDVKGLLSDNARAKVWCGYDAGEKKRIPAWCDRVIYRDNRSAPGSDSSLECLVVSSILLKISRTELSL